MKITFLGATRTVTGSNFLVEGAGKKFLVDCGMWQGKAEQEMENSQDFEFNPAEIDFMLLTHAHIDHSGRIPKLYNEGFKNKVYAHKATCDLCALMLPDSGHIQETETEWKNKRRIRRGEEPLEPIYTAEQAAKSLEIFEPVQYDQIIEITPEIHVRFNDAGHMLGSSIIELWVKEGDKEVKTVFTGDLGNNDIPLLSPPTMIEDTDFLVMESTYGSRLHIKNDKKAELFLNIVSETLNNGGTVVIPSFAVGRTQEILYEINELKDEKDDEEFRRKYKTLMKAPVYVDSPLAISATEVFKENTELFDEKTKEEILRGDNPLEFPGLKFTRTADESKELNEDETPSIIISASGMCEVGRIKHHLKHNLWNPKSTILFVGYQAPGTLGRSIVEGAKKVKIFGEEIAVNARVEYIEGYSGHADQTWLLNFIYSFTNPPKHVFLVHGEPEGQLELKEKIEQTSECKVIIPNFGDSFELEETPKLLEQTKEIELYRKEFRRVDLLDRIEALKENIADIENVIMKQYLDTNDNDLRNLEERVKDIQKQIQSLMK